MIRVLTVTCVTALGLPAFAQEQQAGNAASRDTEATFQALIDKCDDVDALMLRARIRLQLPHTTDEASATAQKMLDEGFATCGGGDLEGAKATLYEALEIAEEGATITYGTADADPSSVNETAAVAVEEVSDKSQDDKPWWKLW